MAPPEREQGFTLAEVLVSVAVLTLLVLFLSRLFTSAASLTATGTKHIDSDLEARQLFDRMGADFTQMMKRQDVDYYVKSNVDTESGNDRIAFFSHIPGYCPGNHSWSRTSLIAYRVNSDRNSPSFNKMERMGKGLLWNDDSSGYSPILFGLTTIVSNWPSSIDSSSPDQDYETIAPQTFRFEYCYFLKDGTVGVIPGGLGLEDIRAICVCIAGIDSRSKVLLSNPQLNELAGRMDDFSASMTPGDLLMQWKTTLDATNDMPRAAISAVRLYQHTFHFPRF
jgi:prepilin-type N-terminal cleavage/methylation domain-containing protein